jgi:hypothetical protein
MLYVSANKKAVSLNLHRYAAAKPARDVAFCLSQLPFSDKLFKKFTEAWKLYEPALYDKEVYAALSAVVGLCKLNLVITHSLKPPGFNP